MPARSLALSSCWRSLIAFDSELLSQRGGQHLAIPLRKAMATSRARVSHTLDQRRFGSYFVAPIRCTGYASLRRPVCTPKSRRNQLVMDKTAASSHRTKLLTAIALVSTLFAACFSTPPAAPTPTPTPRPHPKGHTERGS